MSDTLARICATTRAHVASLKTQRPLAALERAAADAEPPRGFARALAAAVAAGRWGLIAEIKKASPSRGVIRVDFDPPSLARAYAAGGATCLSVLTDAPYFQGAPEYLTAARAAVPLPILRKDFMLDPYQVVEARAIGADCILLILAAIDDDTARSLAALARALGMDVLAEVHDRAELARALAIDAQLLGINNRNLKTLQVDLRTTEELAPGLPRDRLPVSESGLKAPGDLARMATVGVRCFLVGESLMLHQDVAAATRRLLTPIPAEATP